MKYGEKEIQCAKLEFWPNPKKKDYTVEIIFPEFTCLCPRSGYPDFATIRISYAPNKTVVELKSLKLYLNSFRDKHISHEAAANQIYDDIVKELKPKNMELTAEFNARGGIKTNVYVKSHS
ncbi:MAG: NADPH-dependent 7-cyano-7-deazaguanine reductase QueF [Planctomycetes bacterium]|nr:NADPH-dependent 7-cyano-7-deazaguanine reductase QueF [Planctomycetota bacterium]